MDNQDPKNGDTGEITGLAEGTATVKVTLGDVSATIKVTVTASTGSDIPTQKGEGPYAVKDDPKDLSKNYSFIAKIKRNDFNHPDQNKQLGSIKLSDIVAAGFDTSDLRVSSPTTTLVNIGKDKDGDDAIVFGYYGTAADWEACYDTWEASGFEGAMPFPQIQLTLVLSKPGYADTTIKLDLKFEGSMYIG